MSQSISNSPTPTAAPAGEVGPDSRKELAIRSARLHLYTAQSKPASVGETWGPMFRELWGARELVWRLLLRDFSARYRQSVLGYLWAIVPALAATVTFVYLNRSNFLPIPQTDLPYPLFVLVGMSVWQLFSTGLTATTNSLTGAGSLITKINFPREVLVLGAFGQAVLDFVIRLGLLIPAFILYGVLPHGAALLIPLVLLPLCLLTLGIGYLTALANGILRDVGQLVTFLLTIGMFLSPVVYPLRAGAERSPLHLLNPVSPFLVAVQDLISRGYLSQPHYYALGCLFSLICFLVGWRVFHVAEPRIAERI